MAVPCSGDVWVESSAAWFFAEAQLKFSPVEGDKKTWMDADAGYWSTTTWWMKGCRAADND